MYDEILLVLLPVATYWFTCTSFHLLGLDDPHIGKNNVSSSHIVSRVLSIHGLQCISLYSVVQGYSVPMVVWGWSMYSLIFGIVLMDTIEYFNHLLYHRVPLLYAYTHKTHHELKIPVSFGALYNCYSDVVFSGGIIFMCFYLIGFTFEELLYTISISNVATIMDHTNYFDQVWWWGNGGFHRHHHEKDIHTNFSQPFFRIWDRIFGTYYTEDDRQRIDTGK